MATETLSFDILARDLASSSFKNVGRSALDASGSLKELSSRLDKVSGRVAEARVGLQGDKEAQVELDRIGVKLISLGRQTANPNIDLQGALRASAQIGSIDLALDRLDHKTVTVDVRVNRQGLRGLLSSVAGAGFEPGGAAGGLGPLGIGGLIGGGALGAGLVPSLVGAGIGGLTGLGVLGGGLFGAGQGKKVTTADLANIKAITTQLKTAVGQQRKDLEQALKDAQQKYRQDVKFYSPFLALQGALQGLLKNVLAPLRPVMAPLAALITQFGKGLAALGPQFTALFKASLPFMKQFLIFLLQAGKILIPAFTQAMNEMVKSGALQLMTQGLVSIVKGLAAFIVALGPGMKASAVIFARLATFIGRTMGALGDVFTVFAKIITFDVPGAVRKGTGAVVASFHAFAHDIASIFDSVRHFIAASWDATWRDTVGRARSGVAAVLGFFRALPGQILGALRGVGHSLAAFFSAAMNEMWDAIRNVGGRIIGWFGGFVSKILSFIGKLIGRGSPATKFAEIGRDMMLGLEKGIKDHAHKVASAAAGAARGAVSSSALGGDAAANMRLARRLFPWGASQWAPFVNLTMRESGFNRFARNPTSGAYGIPQALPPTKLPFAGQAAGGSHAGPQLSWMFDYISGRYGSPSAAWAHEVNFGWYDRGGWLPPGLSLALNKTGRPEQVIPARSPGHKTVLVLKSGGSRLDDVLVDIIRSAVSEQGGGDVQVALGGSY